MVRCRPGSREEPGCGPRTGFGHETGQLQRCASAGGDDTARAGGGRGSRDLLGYAEPEIRGMAVTGLAKIRHRESLPDVARLMQDEEMEVRRRAAAFMGEVACDEGLSCLAAALQDGESVVRCEALKSLGKIKGEAACDLALQALHDQDWQVRYTAVTMLGEIGHNKALVPLVEIMFGPEDEEMRAWAAWSLGEIADERAIEPLQRAYKTCPTEVMKKAKDSLVEVFKVEILIMSPWQFWERVQNGGRNEVGVVELQRARRVPASAPLCTLRRATT